MNPGIHDITNEKYHGGDGISKSGLWTIYNKSPEHFQGAEQKESKSMDFGTATHMAVLEPHLLESAYCVVPENAPRKPSVTQLKAKNPSPETISAIQWWSQWDAANAGRAEIKQADFDNVRRIRDKVQADPLIQKLVKGAQYEKSAYWIDEKTGELCRCRPDIYNPELRMMADVKTARDADSHWFSKAIEDYGYHVQEAFYSDGWEAAGGGAVDAFVFIAIENTAPFVYQIYELDIMDVEHGRDIYRKALDTYHECKVTGQWPGYGMGVKPISRPEWARKRFAEASV